MSAKLGDDMTRFTFEEDQPGCHRADGDKSKQHGDRRLF